MRRSAGSICRSRWATEAPPLPDDTGNPASAGFFLGSSLAASSRGAGGLAARPRGVVADPGQQGGEAGGGGGGGVFGQADVGDGARFGGQDLFGAAAGVHPQGQDDEAGDDGRVADGGEFQARGVAGGDDPYHRLAAMEAVVFGFQRFREVGQLAAQVDQVLVALGPVAEEGEFVADGRLGGFGGWLEREGG